MQTPFREIIACIAHRADIDIKMVKEAHTPLVNDAKD